MELSLARPRVGRLQFVAGSCSKRVRCPADSDSIRTDLVLPLPVRSRNAHTRRDGVSMHIQPAASLDQLVHHATSRGSLTAARRSLPRTRLCSACSNATMRGAESSHVRLITDSPVPRQRDVARAAAGAW
jgi:hypothetical protein